MHHNNFSIWDYQVPSSQDIPVDLRTTFYNSHSNPNGVLGSMATGEPSVLFGVSALFALKQALNATKKDGGALEWISLSKLCSQIFLNLNEMTLSYDDPLQCTCPCNE
jgi:xanthine dehydrogenase molybdopterin-binding subunit B